jgi:hypothetical protein
MNRKSDVCAKAMSSVKPLEGCCDGDELDTAESQSIRKDGNKNSTSFAVAEVPDVDGVLLATTEGGKVLVVGREGETLDALLVQVAPIHHAASLKVPHNNLSIESNVTLRKTFIRYQRTSRATDLLTSSNEAP